MSIPRIIILEGSEGSGKSTQALRLAERLNEAGIPAIHSFEPGGTPVGQIVRKRVLSKDQPVGQTTQCLGMLFDRSLHLEEKILPALREGKTVVLDRFSLSTMVYQGVLGGMGVHVIGDWIEWLESQFLMGEYTKHTLLLTGDPVEMNRRTIAKAKEDPAKANINDFKGPEFVAQVQDIYKEQIQRFDPDIYTVIDTRNKTIEALADEIFTTITTLRDD